MRTARAFPYTFTIQDTKFGQCLSLAIDSLELEIACSIKTLRIEEFEIQTKDSFGYIHSLSVSMATNGRTGFTLELSKTQFEAVHALLNHPDPVGEIPDDEQLIPF